MSRSRKRSQYVSNVSASDGWFWKRFRAKQERQAAKRMIWDSPAKRITPQRTYDIGDGRHYIYVGKGYLRSRFRVTEEMVRKYMRK